MHTLRKSFIRNLPPRSTRDKLGVLIVLTIILLMAMLISLLSGARMMPPSVLFSAIHTGDDADPIYRIFYYVRLPRTLAGLLAGSALAVAGALIQAVLNNALASPNIIGVNAGAGFCAMLMATVLPARPSLIPAASFLGALGTSLLIYGVAVRTGASRIALVLAGVAISGVLSAGIDTLTLLFPDAVIGANGFMAGGFSAVTLAALRPACWYIFLGLVLAMVGAYDLNVLSLGEQTASTLGMHVALLRFLFITVAALLAGAAVSFAGLLGFVGLMGPHAARRLIGTDSRFQLPASALLGSSFVLLCDTLGRVLFAPYELPVGIIMSILGGLFFLGLLLRHRKGRLYD